jgi:hypothetical protein
MNPGHSGNNLDDKHEILVQPIVPTCFILDSLSLMPAG